MRYVTQTPVCQSILFIYCMCNFWSFKVENVWISEDASTSIVWGQVHAQEIKTTTTTIKQMHRCIFFLTISPIHGHRSYHSCHEQEAGCILNRSRVYCRTNRSDNYLCSYSYPQSPIDHHLISNRTLLHITGATSQSGINAFGKSIILFCKIMCYWFNLKYSTWCHSQETKLSTMISA